VGKGCLAQARAPVEQHMVQCLGTASGRLDKDPEIPLHLFLADIFVKGAGPETDLCRKFL